MIHEEKKVAKIIEELTLYFFAQGANKIESGIDIEENMAVITFRANYNNNCKYEIENIGEYLNDNTNDGIEDIYWELAGSGDPGETSQLLLVGMMIDKADIDIGDEFVTLKLYKTLMD